MKKIIGIALILAVMVTLCFSTVALADEGIYTNWNFNGEGEIEINTDTSGSKTGSGDHLNVETMGSSSSGWQEAFWDGSNYYVNRHVEVNGGEVVTYTVRDNTHNNYRAYTEHGAYLFVSSTGTLDQRFGNCKSWSYMNTEISAETSSSYYDMYAWTEGSIGGYWFFAIGGEGDGSGELHLHTTDEARADPYRLLHDSSFYFHGDTDAGFGAAWGTLADFDGTVQTPHINQSFDVDVSGGSGNHDEGASGAWVTIQGFIDEMK